MKMKKGQKEFYSPIFRTKELVTDVLIRIENEMHNLSEHIRILMRFTFSAVGKMHFYIF